MSDAINSTGNDNGGSAQTDAVDTGLSDDIQSSLTGQGVSDRESTDDADRDEAIEDEQGGDDPVIDAVE
jgi:hypothetical protein